jgi:alpha-beta hydrolase superfamily lysophospholipase
MLPGMARLTRKGARVSREDLTLNQVPATLWFQETAEEAAKQGTILFFHGLGVSRQAHMFEMRSLARAGFLVVGVDAVGHGERRYPDYEKRFEEDDSKAYWEVVLESIKEVPGIIDELESKDLCLPGRLGMAGISMGGYVVYGVIYKEKRIKAASSLIASPIWKKSGEEHSPHQYPERFFPVALLSQTGESDTVVPAERAREFHRILEPYYQRSPERLSYIEFSEACHMMSDREWKQAVGNMVKWFERFLTESEAD